MDTARALTTLTAAAELGIERRVLARWGEAGCPHDPGRRGPGGSARWDVAEVREWMEAVGRTREPGRQLGTVLGERATPADPPPAQPAHGVRADPAGIRSALLAQRLRREVLTCQRIDLDLQQRRGELVPAAGAEAHRLELIHAARAVLLGGPARLALDLRGLDVPAAQALLEAWVWESLAELGRDPEEEINGPP